MIQEIFKRINSRAVAMFVGALLVVAGITFTAMEIKAEGSIDVKSPFISGQVQSGFVGISLITFGMFIVLGCLFFKQKNVIEITVDERTLKYTGYVSDRRMQIIEQLIMDLIDKNMKPGTPQITDQLKNDVESSKQNG